MSDVNTFDLATSYALSEGVRVTSARITPAGFVKFVTLGHAAQDTQKKDQKFEVAFQNVRMLEQVTLISDDKKEHKLTEETLHKMPRPVAMQIIKALGSSDGDGKEGTVLTKGDGITSPVLYELGTPIIGADGKEITELEFIAATYGDIENVLGEEQKLDQALALIKHNAKPAGMLQLPSWALEQITLADGVTIAQEVLPSFTE